VLLDEPLISTAPTPAERFGWTEPLAIGNVVLPGRFNLAPLAGYTNLPFRLTVRELGGLGLATTDLVNPRAILVNSKRTLELIATCPEDRPFAVQIYGSNPSDMIDGTKWLQDYGASIVDINMGCPVKKVTKNGGGSALMCDSTGATVKLVEQVVRAVSIPVTVKMRLGWDAENLSAPSFARAFEEVGVAAVTIHGRTREQAFTGKVDLEGIRAVVEAVHQIPVFGNGDVRSIEDAERMILTTGCDGVAIGRGALANPWFFKQLSHWLKTGEYIQAGSYFERLDLMATHLRRLIEWQGERWGCMQFRKVCTWYCKSLRTPRHIQQTLVMLDTWQTFETILGQLREEGPPESWTANDPLGPKVHVPSGPIAHW
jgi:tRNA-dihydrouridine synthase B